MTITIERGVGLLNAGDWLAAAATLIGVLIAAGVAYYVPKRHEDLRLATVRAGVLIAMAEIAEMAGLVNSIANEPTDQARRIFERGIIKMQMDRADEVIRSLSADLLAETGLLGPVVDMRYNWDIIRYHAADTFDGLVEQNTGVAACFTDLKKAMRRGAEVAGCRLQDNGMKIEAKPHMARLLRRRAEDRQAH